jgi:phosphoribosylformylglycinamidine synthase subunit PurS
LSDVRWLAEVHVGLRAGIADPEGQTIGSALRSLGYDTVHEVRSGKLMRISFEANDHAAAEATVAEMCRRLLANPVMETASFQIRSDEQIGEPPALP